MAQAPLPTSTLEPGAAWRPRVAVLFTDGLADYARAFVEATAPAADILLLGPDAHADAEMAQLGAREVALMRWARHRDPLGSLALLMRLRARIRRFRPDVLHVLSEGQVWLNLLPPLLGGLPLVVTLHDVTTHPGDADSSRVPRSLADRFVRRADAVVVHGERLRRDASAKLTLDPARVFVVPHPPVLRYSRIAETAGWVRPNDGAFRLLFFGRIFPYKGLAHLIAAEPAIAAAVPGLLTTIAGRGEDLTLYRAAMAAPERFDVRERRIPDEEAARLFAQADLLVLPYVEASQSGVLAQAAAFGLPVVASDVGELGATVRASGMGLVVPPADPAALARAVVALAADPALRAQMGRRGRAAFNGLAVRTGALAAYGAAVRRVRPGARRGRGS